MQDGILWNVCIDDCLRILGFAYVRHASLFLTYGLRQRRVDIVAHVTFTSCTDKHLSVSLTGVAASCRMRTPFTLRTIDCPMPKVYRGGRAPCSQQCVCQCSE